MSDFKIVVIGNNAVGCSSIIKRYIKNKFDPKEMQIGIQFSPKEININDSILKFNIWEFHAAESFSRIRDLFSKGAHGGLIVFDVINERHFIEVERHIKRFREFNGMDPEPPLRPIELILL